MAAVRRVLLVDDDASLLRSYCALLDDVDAELLTATTPEDAMAAIRRAPLALVVSDHNLRASLTGADVLRYAAREQPDARRLLLSGEDPVTLAALVDGARIHDFLEKAAPPAAFTARIQHELGMTS